MEEPHSLSSIFSFGRYRGRSVESVYSGEPRELVRLFLEMVSRSFSSIFDKDSYAFPEQPDNIRFRAMEGGWADDAKRTSYYCVCNVVAALRAGGSCEYDVSSNRIRIIIKDEKGEIDSHASDCACEIGREFITRDFALVRDENLGEFRPATVRYSGSSGLESKIQCAEGDSNYIYWLLRKVDGFFLAGSKTELFELNTLPVFSLDSLNVKAGKIKKDFTFKIKLRFEIKYDKIDEKIIKINYEKYSDYLRRQEEKNHAYYSDNYSDDNESEYYDSDDDEDNIMRGLSGGDGDVFGF